MNQAERVEAALGGLKVWVAEFNTKFETNIFVAATEALAWKTLATECREMWEEYEGDSKPLPADDASAVRHYFDVIDWHSYRISAHDVII